MKTFVTSDHHFGSWQTMLSWLKVFSHDEEDEAVRTWNSIVKDGDLVYYLGDFHDCNAASAIECRKKLNGDIILVKGNHDILPDAFYNAMFKDVLDEVKLDGVWLRHIPYDDGRKQIYGHLHRGSRKDPFMVENGFCACASFHSFAPVEVDAIRI